MSFKDSYGLEKIIVSDKLDDVIKNTVQKAKFDKNKKNIKKRVLKVNGAIASLFVAFIVSINISQTFADSVNDVPVISSISNALLFHYDKNIVNSEKQNVNEIKKDKDISITINNMVADDKNLFILYTLNGEMDKNNLKNLLLQNFTIKCGDSTIVDSCDFKSQILPQKLSEKEGEYLILSNEKYKCIVSSLGNPVDSYSTNKKTYGSIELISLSDNSKIPDEISFDISGLTEVYNNNFSKQNNTEFISKYNREPISIQGKWNFDEKIDNSLKSKSPEVCSNIKFSANNTDFNLQYLKIYPTHIDTRIELGENKLNKAQCWSIGRIVGNDKSKLPYLIDESGNKYYITGNELTNIDSNNCISLSFQSCYFNKSKELYLVISQLNYSPGAPFENIEPIKVKIK